ncbi:AcrR family transcriptional regulator [Saccharothrix tamanrassetensis]|uniref:AcrR family transcriptional regulator n=1 Tax=Saccharothrix tamanrassetensis TaxID=1051531 RepID=A0A841CRK1_9PSEU|nr:TetR/AcrR family transcriptional regulator [Saccharothrix tamanrassetensis]MBB5959503.1 AcrR family transcriptional regulator [Saccharothrix tamanrassetensis]
MDESVWERLDRPEKEPKPGLSVRRIVRAAIELADADGLAAVSMARVAERLGFTTMSLYRHVRGKDELLVLVLDTLAEPPATLWEPFDGWRAGMERWCREHLAVLLRHPWALQIQTAGPPTTPNQLAWMDHALRVLEETPLSPGDRMSVLLLCTGFVVSQARFSIEVSAESEQAYGAVLDELVDGERHPALRRVVDAGTFDLAGAAGAQGYDFTFGLARLLDGVERLVERVGR